MNLFHLQHKCCSVIPNKYLILGSLFFMYKHPRIHLSDYHHSDCHLPLDCQITMFYDENIALIPECSVSRSDFKIISQFLPIHSLFEYGKNFRHGTLRKYLWCIYETSLITYVTLLWLVDNSALNKFYLYFSSLISLPPTCWLNEKAVCNYACLTESMHLLKLQSIWTSTRVQRSQKDPSWQLTTES